MVTLGELLQVPANSEADNEILERIKLLVQEYLPEGWQEWKVLQLPREALTGTKLDPQVLNKLRFALSTVELIKAFDPEAEGISERSFRDYKIKLLEWDLTRGLIIGPPALANRIRGSAAQTEIFNSAMRPVKHLILSRSEANAVLSGCVDTESDRESRKRSLSRSSERSCKRSKVEVLEDKMNQMFNVLLEKIEEMHPNTSSVVQGDGDSGEEIYEQGDSESEADSWQAPALLSDLDPVNNDPDDADFDFFPRTKEAEPLIPEPTPELRMEGIECHRFGNEGWNRIRYKDVMKRLQAAPVFSSLKVNRELGGLAPPNPTLTRKDHMMGTLAHGILLQRKALSEGLKKVAKAHPAAAKELGGLFSTDSELKQISDDLLQFVCAYRLETIEMRRKAFTPKNEGLSAALHQIPPSETSLFEEKKLAEFLKDNGGIQTIFKANYGNSFRKPQIPPPPSSRTIGFKRPGVWRGRQASYTSTSGARGQHATLGGNQPRDRASAGGVQKRGGSSRGGSDRRRNHTKRH